MGLEITWVDHYVMKVKVLVIVLRSKQVWSCYFCHKGGVDKPFKLYTDGSYQGIDASLTQDHDMQCVIAYTGQSLNIDESK